MISDLETALSHIPGAKIEVLRPILARHRPNLCTCASWGDDWETLIEATRIAREKFDTTLGLTLIEDTRPLPGIDWQINVDVEKAGRYGANVATVGAMVQLVTRGILLDTMRVDSSDEEIEIRVRLPESDRVLSTLDTLKVRTQDGLVPLSNFITAPRSQTRRDQPHQPKAVFRRQGRRPERSGFADQRRNRRNPPHRK